MLESIFQAALEGLALVFAWPNILYPVGGALLAMLFAAIPGISGVTLMALAIPLTLNWEPIPVMLLFGALVGSGTFMGSMTAILFNIPGTAPNAATILDGYPMACRGEAKTAIGCSAAASALGSTFGIVLLILMIPVMQAIILAIGPPEMLMLAIWGLTTIAAVSRGSMIKGLAAAGLGLMLAFVGVDPRTAETRYTFDWIYLRDGLSIVPVFLGIFAVAEAAHIMISDRTTISGRNRLEALTGNTWRGVRAVFRHFGLFLRSSTVGVIIGMIPGIGGTVASFAAYGQAVQTSKPGKIPFGSGNIRGVLAPEAANDAKDGASLVPTLAFGVPGSEGTTLLLAALILHGLTPGRELFTHQLHLVFVLIWSLFLSNWLTSIFGLSMVNLMARVTVMPVQYLGPFIILIATMAAFIRQGQLGDVVVVSLFGIFGYYMKKYDWPRITLVIALVLGGLFENSFHLTMRLHDLGRVIFWQRPIAMGICALTIFSLCWPWVRRRRSLSRGKAP
ncbi:MAG: tripartite tricarboxylate transporter permease [Desulfosarcina sp.]|nr:tripartite tricarboxylate transporter permease [Desulfobacterales bacterium]